MTGPLRSNSAKTQNNEADVKFKNLQNTYAAEIAADAEVTLAGLRVLAMVEAFFDIKMTTLTERDASGATSDEINQKAWDHAFKNTAYFKLEELDAQVDQELLQEDKRPITELMKSDRKLQKIKDTYALMKGKIDLWKNLRNQSSVQKHV